MHEAVLADVEVARAGAAAPVVLAPVAILCWKPFTRENARLPSDMISSKISISRAPSGCKLAVAVVQNAHGGGEAEFAARGARPSAHPPDFARRCRARN